MALIHLTNEAFDKATASGLAMVDFWATWCGPCKMLSPVIDGLADRYEGKVLVGKVNTDEQPELVVTELKPVMLAARWAAGHREEFLDTVCGGVYGATPEEMGLAFDLPYLFAHREPVLDETAFSMLEEEKTFLLENGVIRAQDDYDLRDWAAPHFLIQALEAADRESV